MRSSLDQESRGGVSEGRKSSELRSDISTLHMFMTRSLQEISRNAVGKKFADLKSACTSCLADLEASVKSASTAHLTPEEAAPIITGEALKLFHPLKLACETKQPKLMQPALDSIHKMMIYGYVRNGYSAAAGSSVMFVDKVVDTICDCYDSPDENVQLQVIKALLTSVTSSICEVHDTTLLRAIRTCRYIYLSSKHLVNQKTAKATITQMIHLVFSRMERYTKIPQGDLSAPSTPKSSRPSSIASAPVAADTDVPRETVGSTVINSETTSDLSAVVSSDSTLQTMQKIESHLVDKQASDEGQTSLEVQQIQEQSNTLEVGDSESSVGQAVEQVQEDQNTAAIPRVIESKQEGIAGEPVLSTVTNQEKEPGDILSSEPPATLPQEDRASTTVASEVQNEHREHSNQSPVSERRDLGKVDGVSFQNVYQRDAYLVFVSLCKQSQKDTPLGLSLESPEMRRKILSLEMIQIVLENSGPVFRHFEGLLDAIKHILCVSILKNGVSPITSIFGLSLSIFLTLLANFKDKLKNEIGVIFTHIFLPILESSNSSIQQKWMIVSVIHKITQEAQTLVAIFLNYDCDVKSTDIYARMVQDMCKIAHGAYSTSSLTVSAVQERSIRLLALQCLVSILKSLVDWCKGLETATATKEDASTSNRVSRINDTPERTERIILTPTQSPDVAPRTQFEKQLQTKKLLEQGIAEFNQKPNKGIKMLLASGALLNQPGDIADFFLETEGLDKAKIGGYLGEGDQFNISVLYAYVDKLDFSGMPFDDAIRYFLSGFRLPGEAQKIDRMMEKFAERYCRNNPSIFKHADTAYVLAYSIIMLNTDAHSPMVKNKMSKADFVRNSSHLHDDEVLRQEFLEDIYDRIVQNEIRLKDESVASPFEQGEYLSQKKRHILFALESERMVDVSQRLFKLASTSNYEYHFATHIDHVRPMFEIVWNPILGALSIILEKEEDIEVIQACLEGFKAALHITSIFYLETERKAFISALTHYTHPNTLLEMKAKNAECIKALLSIALTCGNHLHTCWEHVIRCISNLDRLKNRGGNGIADQLHSAHNTDSNQSFADKKRSATLTVGRQELSLRLLPVIAALPGMGPSTTPDELMATQALEWISSLEPDADRISTNSIRLNDEAIVHFVKKVCEVSASDIEASAPRIFCLHKLVEIAEFNMSRIRYVWSSIWSVMAQHFKAIGCHRNHHISMSAVDALRQLAMKFLEKDELANFHFQKEFLKPFEHVTTYNQSSNIREMVVQCMRQMVLARSKNIKSGWKSVFAVFCVTAGDSDNSVVHMSFQVVEHVANNFFNLISESVDTFVDFTNCLVAYGCNTLYPDVSGKALDHMMTSFKSFVSLHENRYAAEEGGLSFTDSESHMQIWFPVLTGLSRIVAQHDLAVRKKALSYLFELLEVFGNSFSTRLWELIYRGVLSPIFDDIRHPSRKENSDWVQTTCVSAITSLGQLMGHHFAKLSFLLPDILSLLVVCINQDEIEVLAKVGVATLHEMTGDCAEEFTPEMWAMVSNTLAECFSISTPQELMTFQSDAHTAHASSGADDHQTSKSHSKARERQSSTSSSTAPLFNQIRSKCITQLQLIQVTTDICLNLFSLIPDSDLIKLCTSISASHQFASAFNKDIPRRISLHKAGFMSQLPNLLKQETNGLTNWLRIYLRMFGDEAATTANRIQLSEGPLIEQIRSILIEMNERDARHATMTAEEQRETLVWSNVVTFSLRELQGFSEQNFKKHIPAFYPLLAEMVLTNNAEVRKILCTILGRAGKMFVHS